MQQLDGHRHGVAGLGAVEEHNGLQVVAHRHAAAVEVENLRHRPVSRGVKLEPDARAGQVVAAERGRYLITLAKPERLFGRLGLQGNRLPAALVEADGFAMRQVAGMELPCAIGQFAQQGEPVDDRACVGGQRGGNLGGFSGALAQDAACK